MSDHPIKGLMTTAMENLKDMIDVNTIIGDPVETPDGSVILTVSKVGFGFAAGGSQFSADGGSKDNELPFGGGSGGGVSITPMAFLIVNSQEVKMLHIDESTHLVEKILDLAPSAVEKVQKMMSKNQDKDKQDSNQGENKQSNNKSEDHSSQKPEFNI